MDYFDKIEGLMLYAPVYEDYLYEGLKQFREDNVQYVEIRGLLQPVYELDGSTHDKEWILDTYKRVITQFVTDFPDFTGAKFITLHSDWQETQVDYNLVDALLLNSTRIGHGYALYKHPHLMNMVKDRNIAVEVNPLSHQVLKLIDDLRNHPATFLIADNFPLVISSDDPASWEAAPLTDDFYVTFMALTGEEAGLATLKQLAKNSLV
nr:hypothetical protein BaRGS_009928 [Batillaria attramentaria]